MDLLEELKRLDKAATPTRWEYERVDHKEAITFEIGPRVDGSYGFRFVLHEADYEDKNEQVNIARMKGDTQLIVTTRNSLPALLEAVETMHAALEKVVTADGHEMLYPRGPGIAQEALARVAALLGEGREK